MVCTKLGRIWLNLQPKPLIWQLVEKLAEHGNGIALLTGVPAISFLRHHLHESNWYDVFEKSNKFFRPDGTRGQPPGCGSVLYCILLGKCRILRNCLYKANMLNLTMINDESLIFTHAHCRSSVIGDFSITLKPFSIFLTMLV